MKRKILVTLLAFCLIASLCVVGAAADSSVATWDELTNAISDITSGKITLTQDISNSEGNKVIDINKGKNIIIDLGGKTLTACLEVDGAELTLVNGTVKLPVEGNSLNSTPAYVHGSNDESAARDYSVLNVGSDVVLEGTNGYGMIISGPEYTSNDSYGATINIEGTVNGPIFISGMMGATAAMDSSANATTINILDGAELHDTVVMNGDAVVNVYDGATITGDDAIAVKRGTLNIYGGTFIANGEKQNPAEANNSGSETTGSAISITSTYNNSDHTHITVNIMGGNFISKNNAAVYVGHSEDEGIEKGYVGDLDVTIEEGTFTGGEDTEAVYIAPIIAADTGIAKDNTKVVENAITGGTFSSSVAAYVADGLKYEAKSNGVYTYHRTIESAVAAAGNDGSVSMISDGAVVDDDTGHTITLIDGGSEITMTVTDDYVYTLPELDKSGYTFTGWRVNSSNTIVRGGESYPITANTNFTAVWNMIMIPDTYDIAVDQPAHGTVDVSFSNASQGSVITVTATPDEGYELVYITVDGEPISGNSFVMPDHAVEVSALFAEIGKEVNFVDVSRADWFYDYVQYVAQNGLMEGTTRTAFEPNASMTRAMFWTVLARIDGETITGDAWKTLAQTWAVESGISDGTNADALITREQMVTMLYRYAGSPVAGGMAISEFTDGSSVSDYATDAVTWALSEGILTGMGDGILAPQGTATRAQAAAMLMRFVEA